MKLGKHVENMLGTHGQHLKTRWKHEQINSRTTENMEHTNYIRKTHVNTMKQTQDQHLTNVNIQKKRKKNTKNYIVSFYEKNWRT